MSKHAWGLFVAVLAGTIGTRAAADEPPAGKITVEALGLRSSSGSVRCALFNSADSFPKDPTKAVARTAVQIKDKHAVCEFTNVVPGTYAASFIHDENNNGKLDTNWLGMPKEGYGASNNARGSMGPPRFNDAKFAYKGGTVALRLNTQY